MAEGDGPTRDDLTVVATFADLFDAPGFMPGEWVHPEPQKDGVTVLSWWHASDTVAAWEQALYERKIIDPDSDYLDRSNADFVNAAISDPLLLASVDLPTLRRVLTFLVRGERHTGGGWYESAFKSGMAQAATRRLGALAEAP